MLGGDHLAERLSERFQKLNNQPRQRGYLAGCHIRCGVGDGTGGYSVGTLCGNWSEERRDLKFTTSKPVLGTELEKTWTSTYRQQSANVPAPSDTGKIESQMEMAKVVDGRHRCFPGHQPQIDPNSQNIEFTTETRKSYINPKSVPKKEENQQIFKTGMIGAQSQAIISLTRKKTLARGNGSFNALRRTLRVMDTGHDCNLNAHELKIGLNRFGIKCEDAEIRILMRHFDRDSSGEVSLTEFVCGIRGEMNERRLSLVRLAYGLLDKNKDGIVKLDDIRALYDVSKHPGVLDGSLKPDDALRKYMAQWDLNGDDIVTTDEFTEYYQDISAEIDTDQYFELMIRNTWHISGGEGVCKNTSCRRVLVVHTNGRQTVEEIKNDLGIGPKDIDKMMKNLSDQGITDIARIELKGTC